MKFTLLLINLLIIKQEVPGSIPDQTQISIFFLLISMEGHRITEIS